MVSIDLDDLIDALVRPIEDWPVAGVTFRDITPLLSHPDGLEASVAAFVAAAELHGPVDAVIGIESRGFWFAPAVALRLGVGFVPVRKQGKLPAETHAVSYDLEYGSATLELHRDALSPGARVVVIDDVLATGGTLAATAELVGLAGAEVAAHLVLIEIAALDGRNAIAAPVHAIASY